jgi:hypothetical protein
MNSVQEVFHNRRPRPIGPIGLNEVKPIGPIGRRRTKHDVDRVDHALEHVIDLIDPNYRPWFLKQAYRIGVDRFLGLASEARQNGTNPQRYFSTAVRNA